MHMETHPIYYYSFEEKQCFKDNSKAFSWVVDAIISIKIRGLDTALY